MNQLAKKRPVLVKIEDGSNLLIEDLALVDGPRFHVHVSETKNATLRRLSIFVDWHTIGILSWNALTPMFPFNTDGIDVAGQDILIEDIVISNWDDIIAVKPSSKLQGCTENVRVRNITALFGGGLSIGSVSANRKVPCVRDVTIRNARLYRPFKGIYIKTGTRDDCHDEDQCAGLVEGITYEDIHLHGDEMPDWWNDVEQRERRRGGLEPEPPRDITGTSSLFLRTVGPPLLRWSQADHHKKHGAPWTCRTTWLLKGLCFAWPLYVGPQQQMEPWLPHSPGIWASASTAVTVANVTVKRFFADGNWPEGPAAIRCHPENPCRGLAFEQVRIAGTFGDHKNNWICDTTNTAIGTFTDVEPHPGACLAPNDLEPVHKTASHTNAPLALFVLVCFTILLLFLFVITLTCSLCLRTTRYCLRLSSPSKIPSSRRCSSSWWATVFNRRRRIPVVKAAKLHPSDKDDDPYVSLPLVPRSSSSQHSYSSFLVIPHDGPPRGGETKVSERTIT